MEQPVSKELWERARAIFEREVHPHEVWGDSAARQTHTFFERQHHETETLTVVGEETRSKYLEIARAELEYEALYRKRKREWLKRVPSTPTSSP